MTDDITEAELLSAIQEALEGGGGPAGLEPGTITAPRLADQFGVNESKARKILLKMFRAGTIRPDMVLYTDYWGSRQTVKGWRLVTD